MQTCSSTWQCGFPLVDVLCQPYDAALSVWLHVLQLQFAALLSRSLLLFALHDTLRCMPLLAPQKLVPLLGDSLFSALCIFVFCCRSWDTLAVGLVRYLLCLYVLHAAVGLAVSSFSCLYLLLVYIHSTACTWYVCWWKCLVGCLGRGPTLSEVTEVEIQSAALTVCGKGSAVARPCCC